MTAFLSEPVTACVLAPYGQDACSEDEARYLALLERVRAAQPRCCPRCGSRDIAPDFVVLDAWDCFGRACGRSFVPNA